MSDENRPSTRITAHRGHLVIECDLTERSERYIPAGGGQIGCTLLGIDASLLGISVEAMEELRKVGRSRDDIGDISIWRANDGRWCAGWLGPRWKILRPGSESDRQGLELDVPHAVIPNDVPPDAAQAIDGRLTTSDTPKAEG